MMQNINKGLSETLDVQDNYLQILNSENENLITVINQKEQEVEQNKE